MRLFRRNRELVAWTLWEKQLARNFGLRQIHRELKRPKLQPYLPPVRRSWEERVLTIAAWIGAGGFAWLLMALVSFALAVDEGMALWPFGG
jgi:hypothetical protein